MIRVVTVAVWAAVVASACAAKKDGGNGSTLESANANWQRIYECQDQVHIDVDTNERRHIQVVVTDKNIFGLIDQNIPYLQIANADSRIYRGQTSPGVFTPSSFVNVFAYDATTYTATKGQGFEARRYGTTLVFRALDFIKTQCGGSLRDNEYRTCEVWNYTFKGCREVH